MYCAFFCRCLYVFFFFFFFNDTATTEIYTLSLHDALPIPPLPVAAQARARCRNRRRSRPLHHRAKMTSLLWMLTALAVGFRNIPRRFASRSSEISTGFRERYAPADFTLASSSTNFCLRSA